MKLLIPIYITVLMLGLSTHSYSQISIDSITTDTINLFEQVAALDSSASTTTGALFITALLPGAGHQMVQRPYSALAYITIDIVSLFGALTLHHYSQKTLENAKAVAYQHAGLQNTTSDDYFLQIIGNFNNYNNYHQAYSNDFRNFSDQFTEISSYFKWGEQEFYRDQYNKLRRESKRMSTLSAFFVGAMFLNRLVAFIDLRSSSKNKRYVASGNRGSFSPLVMNQANGMKFSTTF